MIMKYPKLFSAGRIGELKLKNRLVMPPMVRNYADAKGLVTDRYVEHIERIAKGGTGMLILEASYVSPEGKGFVNGLGIHADACVPGLKKLATRAHEHKSAIGIQLYHAGRQTASKISGQKPVAPSAIPCPVMQEMPRSLKIDEIKKLVKDFAKAAARAQKAGLDFVEIHGAHGYLVAQFLSPYSNNRKDAYGGDEEKRFRFLKEVYQAVRQAVGEDFPIIVRLSGEEWVEGGLTIKDVIKVSQNLEKLGVDALHISSGNYGSYVQGKMIPPMAIPDGVLLPLAKEIKKSVKIPVITVGKIRTPDLAEKALKNRDADFVAVGRSLLADPDWPIKAKAGKLKEINHCVACNQGCISRLFAQQDVWCTVNPECGREAEFSVPPKDKKKVAVIGGGPAGLSSARTAAMRGHKVVLFESGKSLGGQLPAAALAPHREDWDLLRKYLVQEMKRLKVEVNLEHEFTLEDAKLGKYDAIITAMGSSTLAPKIPGMENTNVVMARDLFEGGAEAKGNVVVVGGGCMGAQTAELLAVKKHPVTLVEMSENIALESPIDERFLLLKRLEGLKVGVLTQTRVLKITTEGVLVTGPQGKSNLKADTVVICLGSVSNDGLGQKLRYLVKTVKIVGDAQKPRRVTDAIMEGALAVLDL